MPTVIITGGHGGIGWECARQLASGPRLDLVLAGRGMDRLDAAARRLRADHGVAVQAVELDLSSLASVRTAAARCRTLLDAGEIDVLAGILCNAGAQFRGPISYGADGYEETFATNCLGHFLLLQLLIDRVGDRGRIVFTASGTHDPTTMDGRMVGIAAEPDATALAYDGKTGKPLSGGVRYTTSKLCTMLYAYELDRRLRRSDRGIASIAFDPGSVPETALLRTMPKPVQWLSRTRAMKWGMRRMGVTMGSVAFSGSSLARLAADPAYADASGRYFQSNNGVLTERRSSATSYDEGRASRLWDDSKSLVGLRPDEESTRLR